MQLAIKFLSTHETDVLEKNGNELETIELLDETNLGTSF